jgi:excisionase family DNA binding protein
MTHLPRHVAQEPDEKLTVAEVCKELKISRSTFYDWRAKRRAPRCITLPNGSLRVRRADLDRWLGAREDHEAAA